MGAALLFSNEVWAQKAYDIASLNVADRCKVAFHGFNGRMAKRGYRDSKTNFYQYDSACSDEKLLRSVAQRILPNFRVTGEASVFLSNGG